MLFYRLIYSFRFDYEYGDIYDEDYWDYLDKLYRGSENEDPSLSSKDRKRRSLENNTTLGNDSDLGLSKGNGTTILKRTNSASSVLGLNILLYQDQNDYYASNWTGVVQNSFLGFKVLCQSFDFDINVR